VGILRILDVVAVGASEKVRCTALIVEILNQLKGIDSVLCAINSGIQHFATTVLPLQNLDRLFKNQT
jgi:hypothetical protein